ncbi:putative Proteasome, beta subunit [Nitrospina gracilis 3/211]|uniref:proteasome endopeptidase complex n=1 Tax=Nitrospina gracilis (strain 3/211) TaxID=1266370 RepID=M1YHB0_NITG3|nr:MULTISPECIES: proteasome, beta subunit [Nitrospina]MCF8722892.1 proteasome beta subunit [Nitrospina sp. Nb-3]CCQ89854.1 putative Proteasome, beta subunit [Nitrospina gracilis 3/211]
MSDSILHSQGPGDFYELLKRSGYQWASAPENGTPVDASQLMHGTTVLAFHYKDGVVVAGDRRATAGNAIMYDRCDKVIPIDDYSLMAIAGVPATAFEMARILSHNFEYYRRSQLQSLSTEGKIRALSKLLKDNMGMAIQGVGAVSPIFASYDLKEKKAYIYFYDLLGANFEIRTHTATGSGSPVIRGVLEHEDLWGARPLAERDFKEASMLAVRLLQTAGQFDSATGQGRPDDKIYPVVASITGEGYRFLEDNEMEILFQESMKRNA